MANEKELDLVEISPNTNPPVCRIIDWSKFVYSIQKKDKTQKHKEKRLKEFRFKAGIGEWDLNRKVKRSKEFLDKGHPVKITLIPTRRVLKESIREIFDNLLTNFKDYNRITDVQHSAQKMSVTFKMTKSGKNKKINTEKV